MEKIGPIDWIKALKHSKVYAEDYKKYLEEYKKHVPQLEWPVKHIPPNIDVIGVVPSLPETKKKDAYFILSDAAKKLCQKYKLRFPIEPDTPYDERDLLYLRSPINYFIPREFMQKLKGSSPANIKYLNLISKELTTYLDGRHVIMIDRMFTKDQIRDEFEKYLDDWFEKSKRRVKSSKVDIWEVYNMHQNETKSLSQIAVEKLESGNNPAYSTEDDRKLKIIKRAYEKACRIIATVERLAHDNL